MKKRILALVMAGTLVFSCGCGEAAQTDTTEEEVRAETSDAVEETESADSSESTVDALDALESAGEVEVDEGLFDVTITLPADYIDEGTTQEDLDKTAEEKGYQSAILNEDGSVTYVMTKAQHQELLEDTKQSIDEAIAEIAESEDYPSITDITANDDYTNFTVTTNHEELDMSESFLVLGLYIYGGMYAVYSGEEVDNIHVDFVNSETGEIITSSDSSEMGTDDTESTDQ